MPDHGGSPNYQHAAQSFVAGSRDPAELDLAHLAAVGWQHINLTGDYLWDADIGLAPVRTGSERSARQQQAFARPLPPDRVPDPVRAILPVLWRDPVTELPMPAMPSPPRLRKRRLEANAATSAADEIDIAGCAAIAYTSEDPAHPVDHMLDRRCGPGGTRWISARPDTVEHIVVEFDRPQAISRLVYEVEEAMRERTQEVRVEAAEDGGQSYRQIMVQEYNFSPGGATYQREEQRFNLRQVTHLRLTIVPNKSGSGTATLTALRLFA
jgi:hypothetical protein